MAKSKKKKPKNLENPVSSKRPRIDPALQNLHLSNPVWQIGVMDLDGRWGWRSVEPDAFFEDILPKIQNFESMKWPDILNRKNHEIKVEDITVEAQKRLAELKLDDFENLVSLRLTGPKRIWGIKIGNIFKILWWDPAHEVYPSKLKHT